MNHQLSVVIPNYNGKNLLERFLPFTIKALIHSKQTYELIVVDDCSWDDSVPFLKNTYPDIKVFHNEKNLGFSKSCNIGLKKSTGNLVFFLNTDIKLQLNAVLNNFFFFKNIRLEAIVK
ncbi:glycosyltransferase [Belliella sp. DSM 107340]|uniref:Glycosyltransferase n=1 Tax=Belliella calami TaxID=2923436 RepID=A0ABS9UV49_9BACT|nr:glycosyltransferase [Belliella calami]MCH7400090.1 glycosyltransferase [Belliella calami]